MRTPIRAAFIAALCLCAAHATAAPNLRNLVRGTIQDGGGKGLAEVRVAFYPLERGGKASTAFTNEEGAYSALGLPEGRYRVIAAKKGYMPSIREMVDVSPNEVKSLDFELRPIALLKTPENRPKAAWILRSASPDVLRFLPGEGGPFGDETALGLRLRDLHRGFSGRFLLEDALYGRETGPLQHNGNENESRRASLAAGLVRPGLSFLVQGARYAASEQAEVDDLLAQSLLFGLRLDLGKDSRLGLEGEVFRGRRASGALVAEETYSSLTLAFERRRGEGLGLGLRAGCVGTGSAFRPVAYGGDASAAPGGPLSPALREREGSLRFLQGEVTRTFEGLGTLNARAEIVDGEGEPAVANLYLRSLAREQVAGPVGLDPAQPWSVIVRGELSMDFLDPLWIAPALHLYQAGSESDSALIPQLGLTYVHDDRTEMNATVLYNGALPPWQAGPRGRMFSFGTTAAPVGYGLAVRRDFGAAGDLGVTVKVNETAAPGLRPPGEDRTLSGEDFILLRTGSSRSTEYGIEFRRELAPGINGEVSSQFGKAEGKVGLVPVESAMIGGLLHPTRESESRYFMARMLTAFDRTDTSVDLVVKWADQTVIPRKVRKRPVQPAELSVLDLNVTQGLSFIDFGDTRWELLLGVRGFLVDEAVGRRGRRPVLPLDVQSSCEVTGGFSITF